MLLDKTNNALLSFYPGERIKFDKRSQSGLIVILDNEQGAFIEVQDFKTGYKNREQDKMTFTVAPFSKEKLNKEVLTDAFASN